MVESLDRLTREEIRTAVKFWLSILDAGITIATTSPEYIYRHDAEAELVDIIIAVVILSRGYEESATKSKRIKEVKAEKRKEVRENGGMFTQSCPAWLKPKPDKSGFEIIPEATATVRRIFKLASQGYGVFRLTRLLNNEGVPTFGSKPKRKAAQWYESYIIRILNNRAVLGEFQPCVRDGYKSKPAGEPIKGYYPQVIKPTVFIAARKAIDSRALGIKRTGKDVPNIFGKLLRNARDGGGFLYIPAKRKAPQPRLEPVGGRSGVSLPLSYQYQKLECAFLRFLTEVKPSDLTGDEKQESKSDDLSARIEDLDRRIAILEGKMETDDDLSSLLDRLSGWKKERKVLVAELEKESHPSDENAMLEEARSIIELIETNPEHYRTVLKQLLRHNIVEEIWMLVFEYDAVGSRGRTCKRRGCDLQVHFKSGGVRTIRVIDGVIGATDALGMEVDLRAYRTSKDKWAG